MILVCICKNYYKVLYSDLATELYFYGKSVLTVCQPNFAVELWYYIVLQLILVDLINNGRIYKVFVHANGNGLIIRKLYNYARIAMPILANNQRATLSHNFRIYSHIHHN